MPEVPSSAQGKACLPSWLLRIRAAWDSARGILEQGRRKRALLTVGMRAPRKIKPGRNGGASEKTGGQGKETERESKIYRAGTHLVSSPFYR